MLHQNAELSKLYERTLGSPGDFELLEQLRKCAKEVLKSLTDEQLEEVLAVKSIDNVPSGWLASIYEVLSEAEPFPALSAETREELLRVNDRDEETIGEYFKNGLLRDLRPLLANLVVVFAAVPRVSSKEQRHLRQTASGKAAWPECSGLVACGLTPLSVYYAADAVVPLLRRLQDAEHLPRCGSVILARAEVSMARPGEPKKFVDYVVAEFQRLARCGEQAAKALLQWLIDVAELKPRVFGGARTELRENGLELILEETEMGLFQRWTEVRATTAQEEAARPAVSSSMALT